MSYTPTDYRGMQEDDRQARLAGEFAGYSAANYALNVSGQALGSLQPDYPPGLTDAGRMWYRDGFDRGTEMYEQELYDGDN